MTKLRWLAVAGLFLLAGCSEPPQEKPKQVASKTEKPKTAVLVNGLGVYTKTGMMGAIQEALEKRGWKVTIINHVQVKYLTHMSRVVIGHSMGANAILKRAQVFKTNHPDLIVSIDAGRAPLWHQAPKTKARTIDIHCPLHPIGGQYINDAAKHHMICGTAHIAMPHDKRVLDIIIKEVEALK